jgi:hypothetical protein
MLSPPGQQLGLAALLLGLMLSLAPLAPNVAQADPYTGNNAARVSAYIKPCFGALIGAQYSMCGYSQYSRGSGYGDDRFHSRFRGGATAYFNCADGANAFDRLLSRLPAGSTIYLRGQRSYSATNGLQGADLPDAYAAYSICEISLRLTKSVIIQPDMSGNYEQHPLLVKAMQGEPCVHVAAGADQVIIRNLTLISMRANGTSCIESQGRDLTLENSNLRYDGDESAVKISAGRFSMADTNLIARTHGSALDVNHASLYISNSRIASTYNGIRADLIDDSRLIGVTVIQLGDWQGFDRGEDARAVDVNMTSNSSIITIDQMKTLFYGNGLYLDGVGEGLVSNSLFYSDHAINSKLDKVRILNNYIFADEIGIDIEDGTAYVGNNHIRLVRTAGILKSTSAQLRSVNNHVATEKCDILRWGDVPPQERSCTPWHQKAEFGIPGGGVDWSIYGILSEACSPAPQEPSAQHVCNDFRALTLKTAAVDGDNKDAPTSYHVLAMGCNREDYRRNNGEPGSAVTRSVCADFKYLDSQAKTPGSSAEPENAPKAQEPFYRGLKAICSQTPADLTWADSCARFQETDAFVQAHGSYEDDETNMALASGKEWLSQELYANENNLYTMSSQTFMPLFDDYLPRPPYHALKGSAGTQGSPDNPESSFGAPPPRNPSSQPPAAPRSPAIPKDKSADRTMDYNPTAR